MIPLNILDYSPVDEGYDPRVALLQTTELAKRAEDLGYKRFWVSEHHHVLSVAGSNPEMLMMHLATSTNRIRIGSGGIMLPHYSAYKVAESFRILEALHPERIDLGIGRSPSYRMVNKAMNENKGRRPSYEQQVEDLYKFLTDDPSENHRFHKLIATPSINTTPEIWTLGTGGGSAKIAAKNGTSYAFAYFTMPFDTGIEIVANYRREFQPSPFLKKPKVTIAVFAVVAETTEEAEEIAKALDLWLLFVESANPPPYYPSIRTAKKRGVTAAEQHKVTENRKRMIVGTPQHVKATIERLAELYQADEITVIPNVAGIHNRMKGIELLAEAFDLMASKDGDS
ncbi:luciferase family oxidoreductase group 1 [Virgibacillus natechei]|uniref:Luciferase family oxidoreductase group 1 n=1 Tax=Virgibacillus natechei TaxID=1216297 RepID=A0ABS4ICE0_9BACI|nr:LLM class flavin-dependent oxidoreductase [Virgibacillus natechei]MBP1968315.1 luciferase family oxidoreductase group 1 [Virgibacillus natechei]UZD13450.1 LLM class flavin-dependent oxidoreductase [Virgibacillus natechei]